MGKPTGALRVSVTEAATMDNSYADDRTAPFHQQHVAPDAMHLPDPFAPADDAKTAALVQAHAGDIFREDAGL